jgi:hypothetical protein
MMIPTRCWPVLWLAFATACGGKLAHRAEDRIEGRVAVGAAVQRLAVEVDFGSITVLADDSDPHHVAFDGSTLRTADEAAVLQQLLAVDLDLHPTLPADGTLRLRAPALPAGVDPATARMVVRAVLRCPARLGVSVRTGIGSLRVDGVAGGVDLETGQGDVVVASCRGSSRIRTQHGEVLIDRHRGDLVLDAAAGSVRAFLDELGTGGVRATASATVDVRLPRTTRFTLDAVARKGRCRNSFGVPIVVEGEGGTMAGAVGGGGPLLELRSTAGPLTVVAAD